MDRPDPTDIFQQQDDQHEVQESQQLQRLQQLKDVQTVMEKPEGRRLVWRLLSISGVFQVQYSGNPADSVFHDGRRSVGNALMNDVFESCPARFEQMRQEQNHD